MTGTPLANHAFQIGLLITGHARYHRRAHAKLLEVVANKINIFQEPQETEQATP